MANWFWSGTIQFGTGAGVMSGTGSPQGVVSAPIGTVWLRTDGGIQSTFYVKEVGVGNTGWSAGGSTSLANDIDVNITSPTASQVLAYDIVSHKWVNADNSGSGGIPGSPNDSIQGNDGGSFAGVPGTFIDFVNGFISIAPTGSGVGLTITGDVNNSDIQDWCVNATTSPAVSIDSTGILKLTTLRFADNTSMTTASSGGPRPNKGNWHGWSWYGNLAATPSISAPYSDNIQSASSGGGQFSIPATATEPPYLQMQTDLATAALGSSGYYGTQGSGFTVGILATIMQRIMIDKTVNCRYWVGAVDSSIGTPIGSGDMDDDVLSSSFIGFRYSTNVGDTYWMAVCNTSGTQTAVSTGIVPDTTAGHVFEFQKGAAGSVNFYIDSVLVANIATNVPTQVLRIINTVYNFVLPAASIYTAYMYWETLL